MILEDENRSRILASNARFRWIFGAIALGVPLALGALFHRQEVRLRALADHGHPGTATLTSASREYADYGYEVDGQAYTWSVSRRDAPYGPGTTFPITYLPEHPDLSRPVAVYSAAQLDEELDLPFQHRILGGFFGFFALAAVACEVGVRRMRSGAPPRTKPLLSPDAAGRGMAVLFLASLIGVNFDPKVAAVQIALFGKTPLGLPVGVTISLATTLLFLPYFWVMPHLMRIVMDALARGRSISRAGIVLAVATAGPEHRRSRAIVIAGLVYFVGLMAAWIAFTDSRGV